MAFWDAPGSYTNLWSCPHALFLIEKYFSKEFHGEVIVERRRQWQKCTWPTGLLDYPCSLVLVNRSMKWFWLAKVLSWFGRCMVRSVLCGHLYWSSSVCCLRRNGRVLPTEWTEGSANCQLQWPWPSWELAVIPIPSHTSLCQRNFLTDGMPFSPSRSF